MSINKTNKERQTKKKTKKKQKKTTRRFYKRHCIVLPGQTFKKLGLFICQLDNRVDQSGTMQSGCRTRNRLETYQYL